MLTVKKMRIIERLIHADGSRHSRFHDANGNMHLEPELFLALITTCRRHLFGQYPELPWITYRAIRYIKPLIRKVDVFEYGAGTSTIWFSRNAKSICSIENNPTWAARVDQQLTGASNAKLAKVLDEDSFISAISENPPFGAYVIDCQSAPGYSRSTDELRTECLVQSVRHASTKALFIIDNTDAYKELSGAVRRLFPERNIVRLSGWVPGIFHPNETTIAFRSCD